MSTLNGGKPKIVFWGTPDFAIPSLRALFEAGYPIAGVVTNSDEPVGRKKKLTAPPVKIFARKHHIPVFQPSSQDLKGGKLEIPDADLYVVAAYGKILPKDILGVPRRGALNIHPSLLPRWRGPSPIQYAILNGDAGTGVTIMLMDEFMDHGPILANSEFSPSKIFKENLGGQGIQNSKFTYQRLHDALATMGAELLVKTLPEWIAGTITPIPQDDAKATFSKILKKEDGRIDWKKSADEIDRQIRAFSPWPGTWTLWPAKEKFFRLRIEKAKPLAKESAFSPGSVETFSGQMLVQTGKGMLQIEKLTPEGGRSLDVSSFLLGHKEIVGSVFI